MLGNGFSGIGSTLIQILLSFALPGQKNLFIQAIIFFGFSTIILLLSAATYPLVMDSEFYKFHTKSQEF
jgi:hypothetical protein